MLHFIVATLKYIRKEIGKINLITYKYNTHIMHSIDTQTRKKSTENKK